MTEDLFPGEEEDVSSAGDLTPSVTSNTSDLLRCLKGNAEIGKYTIMLTCSINGTIDVE